MSGSGSGSGSDKTSCDLGTVVRKDGTLASGKSSPTMERHSIEPLKPRAAKSWKDKGVFGREDVEAWGSDIEEEEDVAMTDQGGRYLQLQAENPSHVHAAHEELVLNDVGSLSQRPQSPPPPVQSRSLRHNRTASDSDGRQSPQLTRPSSKSGAPETVGRSGAKRLSSKSDNQAQQRTMYASGRSKAKMPRRSEL